MKLLYEERSNRLLFPSSFKIYEDKVEAYFWPFKYEISLKEIKSVRIIDKIPWWVGWGLRLHPWSKKLYFAIHHGKSVEIEKKGYWRKVILAVKNPKKFVSILKKIAKA